MNAPRRGRMVAVTIASALAAATVWSGLAADAQTAATGPRTSVTLFLDAPDPAALQALADQPFTDRAQRLAELAALVPGADQRGAVTAALTTEGFVVDHQTSWSVTASAPQSLVTGRFGTAASERTALPQLPDILDGLVSSAYLTTGGAPLLHHLATTTLTGADVRNADAPAGTAPSTGGNDAGLTVATLQLASFRSSDLTSYASENGIADPVASGAYHPVTVDRGPRAADDSGQGDVEVALDQESILSTAPTAHQQPYFAPNTTAGFNDVFASAYDDVVGNAMATAANPHLVAMSVSWGGCEAAFGTARDIATTQTVIASLVAAGVTVFAASGDEGIYDCASTSTSGADTQEDVDFPASSPNVVAVGGTRLSAAASAPNTGSNWTETSWSCTSSGSCNGPGGPGGSGGGVSGSAYRKLTSSGVSDFPGFAKPAYQSDHVTSGPFAAPTGRMVPDIAADADPGTGFVAYTSDAAASATNHHLRVGGTSLAAPLSAAQFTNTLGDAAMTTGVGDIHTALYQAYDATRNLAATDPAKAFRDVVVGSNGAQADARVDPSVSAGEGYDTNTGLGGVLWAAAMAYVAPASKGPATTPTSSADRGSLSVGAALTKRVKHHHGRHRHDRERLVHATWSATGPTTNPVAATIVRITRGSRVVFTSTASSGSKNLRGRRGHYLVTVIGTDAVGWQTTTTAALHLRRTRHHR